MMTTMWMRFNPLSRSLDLASLSMTHQLLREVSHHSQHLLFWKRGADPQRNHYQWLQKVSKSLDYDDIYQLWPQSLPSQSILPMSLPFTQRQKWRKERSNGSPAIPFFSWSLTSIGILSRCSSLRRSHKHCNQKLSAMPSMTLLWLSHATRAPICSFRLRTTTNSCWHMHWNQRNLLSMSRLRRSLPRCTYNTNILIYACVYPTYRRQKWNLMMNQELKPSWMTVVMMVVMVVMTDNPKSQGSQRCIIHHNFWGGHDH